MSGATAVVEVGTRPVGGNDGNSYTLAEVKDVNQNNSTFLVEYENSKREWVNANRVRHQPPAVAQGWSPEVPGGKVEVKCWKGEDDPMFWAEGEVVGDKHDYFQVKLVFNGG
jgi:hypothetical protein